MKDTTSDKTIKTVSDTEVEIVLELPFGDLEKYREAALKDLGSNLELPGFRKGHVPQNLVLERLGPMTILEEMAERAIRDWYPKFLDDNKIDAVGHPQIAITKLAEGNPVGLKVTQEILPEIKLPDYKKIALDVNKKLDAEAKPIALDEGELDRVAEEIKKQRDGKELSEDEKTKVSANILEEKRMRAKDKRRMAIVDAILEQTKFGLPKVLVERQMSRYVNEIQSNLERMGLKWADYLTHAKKTEEEVKEAGRADAEKRVRSELLVKALVAAENIVPTEDEIAGEMKHIIEHYKEADPEAVREYVSGIISNTKLFALLEELK